MVGNDKYGRPVRVAIVGGGCAGIAAAWQLSLQPGYEIHVYEKSWRLGGKGASVRDAEGRILDHGLHVWLGFYDNAFRMMRECYDEVARYEWGPRAKAADRLTHGSIDEAFLPEPRVGVARPETDNSDWAVWSAFFPPAKGLPGEPIDDKTNPFTLANYLLRCFDLLKTLMLSVIGPPQQDVPGISRPDRLSAWDDAADLDFSMDSEHSARLLIERMARLLKVGSLTGAATVLQAVTMLEVWLRQLKFEQKVADSAVGLMEAVAAQTRKLLREVVAIDPEIRTRTEIIDIVMTIAVGLFRDRVLFDDMGLDAINRYDYREWLLQHGATKRSVESRFLTGIYDFVFAYSEGDKERPRLAAGVALRGALRMFFTYRGAMFWRVRAGMGDAVFAPLYKVLKRRNRQVKDKDGKSRLTSTVKFHFLHRLEAVGFEKAPDGSSYVSTLKFTIDGAASTLDRLSRNALDLGCWPDSPHYSFAEALAQKAGTRQLSLGRHFDRVILATGVDDLERTCADAMHSKGGHLPREWEKMCAEVTTVATKAAQVWLKGDLEELGWYRGSGLITALGLSFDTWADMTHTLAPERARRGGRASPFDDARSVAYFCGPLTDADIKRERQNARALKDRVSVDLDRMLTAELRPLWPEAFDAPGADASRLEIGRHVQANFAGSDRYTLSLPGSITHRISPLDRSVENMTIAGDWTACGLDASCVEAAVMSGMLAACAISGAPDPKTIIGYDHP